MVRAKFKVGSIKLTEGSRDMLDASGRPEKDERGYNKRVPCEMTTVELQLGTINPSAAEQFKVGREFYIDFTPIS